MFLTVYITYKSKTSLVKSKTVFQGF